MENSTFDVRDMVDTLGQRKWWVNQQGVRIRRKTMDIGYKANTLAWIIRKAPDITARYAMNGVFRGAPDSVTNELIYNMEHPEEWALEQPFVKALILDLFKAAKLGPADIGLVRL